MALVDAGFGGHWAYRAAVGAVEQTPIRQLGEVAADGLGRDAQALCEVANAERRRLFELGEDTPLPVRFAQTH